MITSVVMSRQANTDFAQAIVDSLTFAHEAGWLSGEVAIAVLGRVADSLVNGTGALNCTLQGEVDQDGKCFLLLVATGTLMLRCQRCLESMAYAVRIDKRLLLVAPGDTWPDDELENDEFDAIEASKTLALLPLIEEEVLLALPIAPRHEICAPPVVMMDKDRDRKPSAFAMLGQFRKH